MKGFKDTNVTGGCTYVLIFCEMSSQKTGQLSCFQNIFPKLAIAQVAKIRPTWSPWTRATIPGQNLFSELVHAANNVAAAGEANQNVEKRFFHENNFS
jgi:hypothetical protein